MARKLLLIALAGGLGTLARYALAGFVHRFAPSSLPWGTVVVNVLGCLVAGTLWALFENRWPVAGTTRVIVLVGFMGAFTTFSAFILETEELIRSAEWMYAVGYVLMQNGLGFAALLAGMALGRMV